MGKLLRLADMYLYVFSLAQPHVQETESSPLISCTAITPGFELTERFHWPGIIPVSSGPNRVDFGIGNQQPLSRTRRQRKYLDLCPDLQSELTPTLLRSHIIYRVLFTIDLLSDQAQWFIFGHRPLPCCFCVVLNSFTLSLVCRIGLISLLVVEIVYSFIKANNLCNRVSIG
jgi:hypothetical protein